MGILLVRSPSVSVYEVPLLRVLAFRLLKKISVFTEFSL